MRATTIFWAVMGMLVMSGCATVGHGVAGIDNFDRVSGGLYRGAQPSAVGVKTLKGMGVKTVINLRDGDDTAEAAEVKAAGMTYVRLPLDAEKVTVADAEKFLQVMGKAEGPVFVHCLVGRDRTGMAVAAYRVRVEGWTAEAAVADLNAHGHFWVWFPKVREAVEGIARVREVAKVAAGVSLAERGRAE